MFKNLFGKKEEAPLEVAEDWGNYFCHVESKPASIRLNLALKAVAPIGEYKYRTNFSVLLQNPDEQGFTTREEFPTICEIEDDLLEALTPKGALVVGALKTDGMFDLYFYSKQTDNYESIINKVMQKFGDYKYMVNIAEDAGWDDYSNFLYPSDYEYQSIQNQRVIMNLEKHGDKSEKKRPVDHWLYFASEEGRIQFVDEVSKLGYTIAGIEKLEDKENPYQLHILRHDTTIWRDVNKHVWELITLAQPLGGAYDGWGCPIEA